MKPRAKKIGFTIIELLTVMSIIVVLIGILVPSLNAVRRYSKVVLQKSQFHDISKGLETFSADFPNTGYPDSSAWDFEGDPYCGAMKLCEAMVGQDGLGFHPDSVFDDKGYAADGTTPLYFNRPATSGLGPFDPTDDDDAKNVRARKPLYVENVQIEEISVVLPDDDDFDNDGNCPVLLDVFKRGDHRNAADDKLGMPVLYYKADPTKYTHDANSVVVAAGTNIYNYLDNEMIMDNAVPWLTEQYPHPMYDDSAHLGPVFYEETRDKTVKLADKPHNQNSFILLSAGWDGLYGTEDDIFNFEDKTK